MWGCFVEEIHRPEIAVCGFVHLHFRKLVPNFLLGNLYQYVLPQLDGLPFFLNAYLYVLCSKVNVDCKMLLNVIDILKIRLLIAKMSKFRNKSL